MCDCEKKSETEPKPSKPSRRKFLKATGAIVATAAMQPLTAYAAEIPINPTNELPESDIQDSLEIARSSKILRDALDELKKLKIDVDITRSAVKQSSLVNVKDISHGLVLKHTKSPSQRMGSEVLLSISPSKKAVEFIQVITGWCFVNLFYVNSIIYDIDKPAIEAPLGVHASKPLPLVYPVPRYEWSMSFPEQRELNPEEFTQDGWPPERSDTCYWYFRGLQHTNWVNTKSTKNKNMIRGVRVFAESSCKPYRVVSMPLDYDRNVFDPSTISP